MNAIVSMAFGREYQELSKLTYPTISRYAKSIGATFVTLNERRFTNSHYEKFQLEYQLNIYDRLIWIDADCIVKAATPNLFELVPCTHFAAHDELPDHPEAIDHFNACRKELNHPACNIDRYFNSGVMVFSQCHKKLLVSPSVESNSCFDEQTHLNVRLALGKWPTMNLPWIYNCMGSHHHETHRSHIVHYSFQPMAKRIRKIKWLLFRSGFGL